MSSSVPKRIFLYWDKGWVNAPDICKQCRRSWIGQNPTWEVVSLDNTTLATHVSSAVLAQRNAMTIQAFSDVLRIHLLQQHGGVWVDATTFCVNPLDTWLEAAMNGAGFFAFDKPGGTRPLSSWFLAASKESVVVGAWHQAVVQFWSGRSQPRPPYYWFHMLFTTLPDAAKQLWQRVSKISADGPHLLLPALYKVPVPPRLRQHIVARTVPVYKLTWKLHHGRAAIPKGSVLDFLFHQPPPPQTLSSLSEPVAVPTPPGDSRVVRRCFVINLQRSTDRWSYMQAHLKSVQFPVHRFDAVDGFALKGEWAQRYGVGVSLERRANADGRMGDAPAHFKHCPGAYGVFLSHRAIWQRIVAEELAGWTLVLEDDAQCTSIAQLQKALPRASHFVWLTRAARRFKKGISASNIAAYAVDRSGVQHLLAHTATIRYPIDRQVAHVCNEQPALLQPKLLPLFTCHPFPRTLR